MSRHCMYIYTLLFYRCSVDEEIFGQLTYSDEALTAFSQTRVFSLADVNSLKFECKISFCILHEDGCKGITVNLPFLQRVVLK